MAGEIRLSPKHGVNPMLVTCFLCGGETGELALLGRLKDDAEAPRKAALPGGPPCEKCKEFMTKGVILISVKNGEDGSQNPYRTGGWVVVSDAFVKRCLVGPIVDVILEKRATFVPDEAWEKLGLPREERGDE